MGKHNFWMHFGMHMYCALILKILLQELEEDNRKLAISLKEALAADAAGQPGLDPLLSKFQVITLLFRFMYLYLSIFIRWILCLHLTYFSFLPFFSLFCNSV